MALTAVFFDLDNTLIDYAGYKLRTATAAALELVRRGFPDTVENLVKKIFEVYAKRGMEYQKTMHDVIVQYGLEVGMAEMFQQASLIEYNRVKFNGIHPYPEALDVLKELREMRLRRAIVTDGPRNKAWQRILLARLEDEFDAVVTKDDAGETKPHHAPFRTALRKVGTIAKRALMVGDSINRDMYGARRLGMRTCYAIYGNRDREAGERKGGMVKVERRRVLVPDFRINELKDLPPLAARLMK